MVLVGLNHVSGFLRYCFTFCNGSLIWLYCLCHIVIPARLFLDGLVSRVGVKTSSPAKVWSQDCGYFRVTAGARVS